MKKRFISILALLVLLSMIFASCGATSSDRADSLTETTVLEETTNPEEEYKSIYEQGVMYYGYLDLEKANEELSKLPLDYLDVSELLDNINKYLPLIGKWTLVTPTVTSNNGDSYKAPFTSLTIKPESDDNGKLDGILAVYESSSDGVNKSPLYYFLPVTGFTDTQRSFSYSEKLSNNNKAVYGGGGYFSTKIGDIKFELSIVDENTIELSFVFYLANPYQTTMFHTEYYPEDKVTYRYKKG